jgi:agmatinase
MKDFRLSKQQKIANYDPSEIGLLNGKLFGLPFTPEESEVIVIPMPWEVTVSYRTGTARGPGTMLSASTQVDLYNQDIPDAWKLGVSLLPIPKEWMQKNKAMRRKAEGIIDHLENGGREEDKVIQKSYQEINAAGADLNSHIQKQAEIWLKKGKSVAVLGGEHSVSQGLMQALNKVHPKYSILHIDAHADLREAYEGFEYSHASIMYNASKFKNVDQMVLVGIRDYSQQEADRINNSKGRMIAFDDLSLKRKQYEGQTWKSLCEKMIKPLSDKVYISYDIDALDPSLCPHTGTPVPGGLEFEQVMYLIEMMVKSGRTIIGFDLCEVAPSEDNDWDSIVGVRALYRLATLMAKSQGK